MHLALNRQILSGSPAAVEAMHWCELVHALQRDPRIEMLSVLDRDLVPIAEGQDAGGNMQPAPVNKDAWAHFQQVSTMRQARQLGVDLVFHPFTQPTLSSTLPQVVLNHPTPPVRPPGFRARIQWAISQAAQDSASLRLTYADLGVKAGRNWERVEPWISSGFYTDAEIPERPRPAGMPAGKPYLICHGLDESGAELLCAAWSWVVGSVGDQYAIVVIGADHGAGAYMRTWADEHDWGGSLLFIPEITLAELSSVYHGAWVYIQIEAVRSGQSLRWAQASGAAVVGLESPDTASIIGPAGYLVPGSDSRTLGAAILTLLVEDGLRQELRGKGLDRADRFRLGDLPAVLVSRFQDLLAGS